LSGGQQQRVAVARALVGRPQLVLADEPTANLDSESAHGLLDTMRRLNAELGTTFIFSTHDPQVMRHARRIVHLRDGQVVEDSADAVAEARRA
jgi:putative ABC transport system ATP-binding protein